MTPRPYTISGWQSRAIAEDRLGLIVMPLKPQPNRLNGGKPLNNGRGSYSTENCWKVFPFAPGDLLWCRETFTYATDGEKRTGTVVFRSDAKDSRGMRWSSITPGDPEGEVFWRSPVTMPKWASRTTLRVLSVDVKRMQDITEEEAILAGMSPSKIQGLNAREDFATELCDLWPANPWCAFDRVKVLKMNVGTV